MILALDIGNTIVDIGLFQGEKILLRVKLPTRRKSTPEEYFALLHPYLAPYKDELEGMILSSVVPSLTASFRKLAEIYLQLEILEVNSSLETGLRIDYEPPEGLGADRIANAVGVASHYSLPAVVVDFGTAITMEIIDATRTYRGGIILPGIGISLRSLFQSASLLEPVEIKSPSSLIGKSTRESILSGIVNGYSALVEGMVERFEKEIGERCTLVITGGEGEWIKEGLRREYHYDPLLTLKGLRIIYEMNKGGREK